MPPAEVESPSFIPSSEMVNLHNSNGSGGSGPPFLGYAVQRMPVGLAKELKLNSSGSAGMNGSGGNGSGGNGSGGVGGLVNLGGSNELINGSLGSGGSGAQRVGEGGTSQLDMSLNNLFDSIKMKNGPLAHSNEFDLT